MANIAQGKGKWRESGLGDVIDFLLANARLVLGVGGAAVLAIATVAVKRMFDKASDPPDISLDKPVTEPVKEEYSWIDTSPKLLNIQLNESLHRMQSTKSNHKQGNCQDNLLENMKPDSSKADHCVSLQEKLLAYYTHRSIPPAELSRAKQCAMNICMELQKFLHSKHPSMPLEEMHLSGSLYNDLQMVAPDHVCLMLPLLLEDNLWTLISGEETILNIPDLWMVRRDNMEYFPRGISYWDRFIVGRYLSPKLIVELFHKMVLESMNWLAIGTLLDCIIRPEVSAEVLQLKVQHNGEELLGIDILPMIEMEDTVLLSRPQIRGNYVNIWQQSFWAAETSRLRSLDSTDLGFRFCCLKVLKAVSRDQPSLRKLTSSQLINVILHLSQVEKDWTKEALAERALHVLQQLVGYLEAGCLPAYFNNKVNLLSNLSEEEVDEIGYTLYCAVSHLDILFNQ
ncbi:mitochondrial dynamics protein MID51-like [Carcharodon carcharias]|uniref:mitochondrial dynamics protein MID51-like n=1 Tax=Carcharodon carcharias TaxID=13397 RepID=UPI001B7F34E8|nr:mitochondrial dynamics protein MID51-like [Carcharodon carcharias]XP_041061621.1 mitochondrial dynamics protein MID51-like [Carcharodon carcharias]